MPAVDVLDAQTEDLHCFVNSDTIAGHCARLLYVAFAS